MAQQVICCLVIVVYGLVFLFFPPLGSQISPFYQQKIQVEFSIQEAYAERALGFKTSI